MEKFLIGWMWGDMIKSRIWTKILGNLLEHLELGGDIKLSSGHIITWSKEDEDIGFLGESKDGKVIFQIGSETVWMALIHHARKMPAEEVLNVNMANALTKSKRN